MIIDVLSGDGAFSMKSAIAIDAKRAEGLIVAPITYIELAPSFIGDAEKQNDVLADMGIEFDFAGNKGAVLAAHKAWHEHVMRKRIARAAKRPIADVLIGAFAMQMGGLITRNVMDFSHLYPNLTIFNPASIVL